jgi:pyruvate dehydrogenase E2 component (dihydrolipoamide acetyltransferase)
MSENKNFHLPDLGEGLPDATIVEWFVKVGDVIALDAPLVSMETAKAVVEVPSPFSGKVLALAGGEGDIIPTGSVLAQFELDPNMPQRADGQDTGHSHGHAAPSPTPSTGQTAAAQPDKVVASDNGGEIAKPGAERDDAGTVVGAMQSSNAVHAEQAVAVGGVKAVPAVRATARKLGVDLTRVRATGTDGAVTMADVKQAAADGSAKVGAAPARAAVAAPTAAAPAPVARAAESRTPLSAAGRPMRTQPPGVVAKGQPEPLKGVRRNMARVMADAHSKVVPTTLNDDADIHAWVPGNDVTARLVRSIVVACQKVPALNAWFDGDALTRTLHNQVDIGIAVDTDDGLFVPALRNADMLDARGIREGVNRLREQVESRSIAASELSGYTISLSNFGMFARHQMTPVMGGVEAHKVIPLSVTFDHRAATGGEAARFLRAMLDDLALAS